MDLGYYSVILPGKQVFRVAAHQLARTCQREVISVQVGHPVHTDRFQLDVFGGDGELVLEGLLLEHGLPLDGHARRVVEDDPEDGETNSE